MRDAGLERALRLGRAWGITPEETRATTEDPGFAAVLARLRQRLGYGADPFTTPEARERFERWLQREAA